MYVEEFPTLKMLVFAMCVVCLAGLSACGDVVGTPCETVGSGFHASHDCRHKCLSRWQLICPDGKAITPKQCTGSFDCQPGSCPQGQVCYHDDDPFDDRSFCVSANICGDLDAADLADWEQATVRRQAEVRAAREEKAARKAAWQAKHGSGATSPADAPAPAAPSTAPRAQTPQAAPVSSGSAPASSASAPPALGCSATAGREVVAIGTANQLVPINAGESYSRALDHGWRFALQPVEHGWTMHIWDRDTHGSAVDLSSVTPPLRTDTNTRFLYGWHFRNRANTGPNTGDVNAPQYLRPFEFEPELAGTGGYRPPQGSEQVSSPGRGWLRIETLQLTEPVSNQKAAITNMSFSACVSWPTPDDAQLRRWQAAVQASRDAYDLSHPAPDASDLEVMASCGMPADVYALEDRFSPRQLQLDIDGDDALDVVFQSRRIADNAFGLALCRAGTWFEWVGPEHPVTRDSDMALTISASEAWRVVERDHGAFGYENEPAWPRMVGQGLVIERIEKSMLVLYWRDTGLAAHKVYRMVEPDGPSR